MSQRKWIYITAGLLSLVLSFWAAVSEVLINPDAVCYLLSAESMSQGLSYATHLCDQAKWPFYSILIYGVAWLTKLSYLHSAYLLNGLFSLISVITFIAIISFLKNSPRLLWLSAFVILLAHEFNAVRVYIIRDHGFWAFYLLSIGFLLRYFRYFKWRDALAWNFSLLIATLFRIEGAFFLLFLPFLTLFISKHQSIFFRFILFLKLNTFTFIGTMLIGSWLLFFHSSHSITDWGRINEIEMHLMHGFNILINDFHTHAQALAQHVLSQYTVHDAMLVLFLVLINWYSIQVITNLSIIYSVLAILAGRLNLLKLNSSEKIVLWSYIIINVAVTAIFFAENMFLTKRYLLALSLTLMLWVPFALDYLCVRWQKQRWSIIFLLFIIIIFSLSGIFNFGVSKKYIHDAGDWLAQNVPAKARLYSNDYQVMYYSQHFGNAIFEKSREYSQSDVMNEDKWKKYDYVALRFNKKDNEKDSVIALKKMGAPVQVFMNKRGDEVRIYKIH